MHINGKPLRPHGRVQQFQLNVCSRSHTDRDLTRGRRPSLSYVLRTRPIMRRTRDGRLSLPGQRPLFGGMLYSPLNMR